MKRVLISALLLTTVISANAATITLVNSSSDNKFSVTATITGVQNSVTDLQYSGLDGATKIASPALKKASGDYQSKVVIVPNKSGAYNVVATAMVDGNSVTSNTLAITVSDAEYQQVKSQIHSAESQAIQTIQAERPLIKQEIQQQQQFVNQLSNALNGQ